MKKRVLAVLLACALSVSMVACSNASKEASSIDWSKHVTLIDYKGLEKPTDEEVEKQIEQILLQNGTLKEVTGRAVQEGDTVNIDFEGKKDGVAFEGGTSQGFDLKIGSGQFIPGFEEGLVGANIGETRDLNLTFPKDYKNNEELAGQDVVFTVKVNAIKESQPAQLNDDFVKTISSTASTVDEYKQQVRENLELSKDWNEIIGNSQIEFPKGYVKNQEKQIKEEYEKSAKSNGMKLEDYLLQGYRMTLEQFEKTLPTQAENKAKQTAITRAICKAEGIEISKDEYKEKAQSYAEQSGLKSVEELEKQYSKDYIEEVIMFEKVKSVLLDKEVK